MKQRDKGSVRIQMPFVLVCSYGGLVRGLPPEHHRFPQLASDQKVFSKHASKRKQFSKLALNRNFCDVQLAGAMNEDA